MAYNLNMLFTSKNILSALGQAHLFIILATVYPIIGVLQINYHMFTSEQILRTLFFLIILFLVSNSIIILVTHIILAASHLPSVLKKRVMDLTVAALGVATILYLFKANISYNDSTLEKNLIYLGLPLFVGMIVYKARFMFLNIILASMLISAIIQWGGRASTLRSEEKSAQIDSRKIKQYGKLKFVTRPNVYFILLESFHSAYAVKKIYNYDNSSMVNKLSGLDFSIYDNTYSNYESTLSSLLSIFLMDHHYNRGETGISDNSFARSIIGGNRFNPTLTIFKHNGYQVDYLLQNSHDLLNDHPGQQIDFTFFGKNEATAAISLFRSKLLKKIYYFFWENRPSVSLAKDEFINKIKKRIDDASNERPTFYFIKAGAAHSVKYSAKKLRDIGVKITDSADTKERPWIYLDYWIEEYRKIYRHAEDELLDLVTHIIDKDNSAVIIALGDHGSFRYRGLPSRNLSIDKMRKEMNQHGVDEQLITEDMFGVFCAIRWPRPAGQQIREISILSNVNIFKYLFSELAQQPDLLSTMAPNISYASAKHGRIIETVREGTPLLNWKEVDKTKLPH